MSNGSIDSNCSCLNLGMVSNLIVMIVINNKLGFNYITLPFMNRCFLSPFHPFHTIREIPFLVTPSFYLQDTEIPIGIVASNIPHEVPWHLSGKCPCISLIGKGPDIVKGPGGLFYIGTRLPIGYLGII